MVITFVAVALIPLFLIALIFLVVRMSMSNRAADSYSGSQGITDIGINIEEIVERTDKVYNELDRKVHSSPAMMEDSDYLDSICDELSKLSSTIVVRKGDALYYAGNGHMAEAIWDRLPPYGYLEPGYNSSLYYEDLEEYVRQLDFTFQDGVKGSVFIVVRVNTGISRKLAFKGTYPGK